eukprot:TRINITY_DN28408_c0_g1_i1.p1 TRINITY_DN28408_c0_g1~~TRINITY_DN28408_c0_g1_i1.p1  ORF type:complete len:693 (-),score=174.59 TRINITY_DN28408_c0_g1_i1:31-2109(-)
MLLGSAGVSIPTALSFDGLRASGKCQHGVPAITRWPCNAVSAGVRCTYTAGILAAVAVTGKLSSGSSPCRHVRAAGVLRRARGRRSRPVMKKKTIKKPVVEEEELGDLIFPAEGMTVAELADMIRKPVAQIVTFFFVQKGKPLAINDFLDRALISEVCDNYELDYIFDDEKETVAGDRGFLVEQHEEEDLDSRPPVVTVMGHVDHGKTTLLDTMRKRSVAAGEAGGITQRIGAYTVDVSGQKVTFIDTPGHEAFTAMRARGAQVTDIAIVVVAADDGVMPQTREAIAHAKAAEVPIIVAINKIDVPNADPEKTRQALSEEGILAEDWGGDIPMVEVSAKKNINLDSLLEIVSLTAEVGELKANRKAAPAGVVLESVFDTSRGSLATLLVQRGTLRKGDNVASGTVFGRVRIMQNEAGNEVEEAGPSTAVQVSGFDQPPQAGDQFEVFPTPKEAKQVAEKRAREKKSGLIGFTGVGSDSEQTMKLALILKTDAQGSIAAVKHMFSDVKDSKFVNLRWVLAAPGQITVSDVELASTCPEGQRVMILGFNAPIAADATKLAKTRGIVCKTFDVIYELHDTVVKALQDDLEDEEKLVEQGMAEVKAVFGGRDGKVAGSEILEGRLTVGNKAKVFRDGEVVGEGVIRNIRVFKEEVQDVEEGNECGISVRGFEDWKAGDELHCYEVTVVKPQVLTKG